jgi:hypothetical protein
MLGHMLDPLVDIKALEGHVQMRGWLNRHLRSSRKIGTFNNIAVFTKCKRRFYECGHNNSYSTMYPAAIRTYLLAFITTIYKALTFHILGCMDLYVLFEEVLAIIAVFFHPCIFVLQPSTELCALRRFIPRLEYRSSILDIVLRSATKIRYENFRDEKTISGLFKHNLRTWKN